MENQPGEEKNPFEGFLENIEKSEEMPDKEADEMRRKAEQDAKDSEQTKRTDDLG